MLLAVISQSGEEQTTNPVLSTRTVGMFNAAEVRAQNVDLSSALVRLDCSNPPTTSQGTIASFGYTSWIGLGCSAGACGISMYSTAQASGKAVSTVSGIYVD